MYEKPKFPSEQRRKSLDSIRWKMVEENNFDFYADNFFRKTLVNTDKLDFIARGWLLVKWKEADDEQRREIVEFANKYKEDGLKSFTSIEASEDNYKKLMFIDKNLKQKQAAKIYNKLAELSKIINKTKDEIINNFFSSEFRRKLSNIKNKKEYNKVADIMGATRSEMFNKMQNIINLFVENISSQENIGQEGINELIKKLEEAKVEIAFLAANLKDAKKRGEPVNWENIKHLQVDISDFGEPLPYNDEEIVKFALKCRMKGGVSREEAEEQVGIRDLKAALKNPEKQAKQKFYFLNYQNNPVAMNRFEEMPDGRLYAASLSLDPEVCGLKVIDYFHAKSLAREVENGQTVTIKSFFDQPANTLYVERSNFVISGWREEDGKSFFTMENSPENKQYAMREGQAIKGRQKNFKVSEDELIKIYKTQANKTLSELLNRGEEIIIRNYDIKEDYNSYAVDMKKILPERDKDFKIQDKQQFKYIGSRYFRDKRDPENMNRRYVVFEKVI